MRLKTIIKKAVAVFVLAFTLAIPSTVPALVGSEATAHASTETSIQDGINKAGGSENTRDLPTFIKSIVNILLFVIGAISVIIIIIGGIRYVTSAGDSNQISGAKNTILYAVVGVVIALMAYAIVNFVLANL